MTHKIAYIVSRFPTITETFVLYEMIELQKLGFQIDVYSLIHETDVAIQPGAESFLDNATYANITPDLIMAQLYWLFKRPLAYLGAWVDAIVHNIGSPKFLSRALMGVPIAAGFARKIAQTDIQHLHAHFATHTTLVAYVINKLTGIPYSLTAHAHDLYVDRSMLQQKLANSRLIVTISDYNQRLLDDLYGNAISDKVQVIHCGIDVDLFKPRPEKPSHRDFKMVCVGSLRDYKGQQYLVEACAILRDNDIPFTCNFVGDGDDRPLLEEKIAALSLHDSVHILGYQTRDKVIELLYEADVFVLPSVITANGKMEGIPVALMEALAMTMPVVTTQISGIPELVIPDKTGYLVPERDPQALAEALIHVYKHPEYSQQLGQQGRQHVIEQFDLTKNAQQLSAALNTLLSR